MVLKSLRERLEKAKARAHGMTVPQLREHLAKRKEEKRKFNAELRRKELEEKQKFEKWRIEQKYKRKRTQAKKGGGGIMEVLEMVGGSPQTSKGLPSLFGSSGKTSDDPLGLFGSSTKKRKRRKKKR